MDAGGNAGDMVVVMRMMMMMMRMVMMIVTVGKQSGVLLSVNINTQQSRLVAFVSLSKLSFHFSKFYNLVKEIDTVNPISLKSYILHSFPNWLKTNVSSYQNAHSSETVSEKDLSHKSTNHAFFGFLIAAKFRQQ